MPPTFLPWAVQARLTAAYANECRCLARDPANRTLANTKANFEDEARRADREVARYLSLRDADAAPRSVAPLPAARGL